MWLTVCKLFGLYNLSYALLLITRGEAKTGHRSLKNRSEIEIMASILRSATKDWEYKTTIMTNAMVSHSQLIRYLAIAVERRLVTYSEATGLYRITDDGLMYLDKYEQLLRLLPTIPEFSEVNHSEELQQEV